MAFKFDYSREKDLILREIRGIGFKEVISAANKGKILDDLDHRNKKRYPNQRLLIVEVNKYVYVVPYVLDNKKKRRFLKTLYPNRKMTRIYLKGKKK